MSPLEFRKKKNSAQKLSLLTCYDAWSARILDESSLDALLVGDSVAMVVHGHETTLNATLEMMVLHTQAVARGAKTKLIIADMPFFEFRKGPYAAAEAAGSLMQAGAHAVKLEGVEGHEDVVRHLVGSGIPVMGHLGLTPQAFHQLGGFKVQGKDSREADRIFAEAKKLEELGCFSLVLECVPSSLAEKITKQLAIPTIGIGAGPSTDGQILVLQDMLGAQADFNPRFLRRYGDLRAAVSASVEAFQRGVTQGNFPSMEESYS